MAQAEEPTVVVCSFEELPLMMLTFRGGMGKSDNTLQVGDNEPVALSVGSGLMIAEYGAQEFTFSLRLPASITISNSGSGGSTATYNGTCISNGRWKRPV